MLESTLGDYMYSKFPTEEQSCPRLDGRTVCSHEMKMLQHSTKQYVVILFIWFINSFGVGEERILFSLGDTYLTIYLSEANSVPMEYYTTLNHITMSMDRNDAANKF